MALKDVVKVSRKTFFNPSSWLGYNMLKSQFRTSWSVLKNLYTIPQARRRETFAEALARHNVTEENLLAISGNFLLFSMIFIALGLLTITFSIYLLFHHGSFAGFIIGVATSAIFFAYAFRYSFWRFQIKHRKLGCTFDEWLRGKPSKNEDTHHVD